MGNIKHVTTVTPVEEILNILEKNGQKKWGHLESYKKYIKNTPRLFFKIFG